MNIEFTANHESVIPIYGNSEAAGIDLRSNIWTVLKPGERAVVPTGVAVAIPENFFGSIRPRSGLAVKYGIDVMAGVVDSDYRGEVGVVLINFGDSDFHIKTGDRIAQMVIQPYIRAVLTQVEVLEATERGSSGYGSTGIK